MKKLISGLFAVVLAVLLVLPAFAYESLIDDSANLFSQAEIDIINAQAEQYSGETGLSLAVLTTDDTQGRTTEDYVEDYYDDLADNHGWSENGMVLIIDMDNRIILASAVGDTWDFYSDSEISYITDCGYNEVSNGAYADAVTEMIGAALETYSSDDNYYGGGYYYNDDNYYDDYGSDNSYHDSSSVSFFDILVYIVIGLAVAALSVFIVKSKYKNLGKGDEFDADDMQLTLTGSTDNVISRNVATTKIPRNNNNGSSGGRVSVHRSSGGRVHRSSGRRF